MNRRDALRSILALPVVGPAVVKELAAQEAVSTTVMITEVWSRLGDNWVLSRWEFANGAEIKFAPDEAPMFAAFDEVT